MKKHCSLTPRATNCLAALGLLFALYPLAQAQSPCAIGLRSGSAPTIDGNRGTEWNDASITSSGNACLNKLEDVGNVPRNVRLYSKRYFRGAQEFFGFFLEVEDTSAASGGGLLVNGERFVLQLSPNTILGTNLENGASAFNKDYQIVITHKWESSAGDPDRVMNVDTKVSGRFTDPICATNPIWDFPSATSLTGAVAVRKDLPGGYKIEVEISLALFGQAMATNNVGVAFAVINDWGTCVGASCDAGWLSFPNTIPITNADNPVRGCMDSWVVPNLWGTGVINDPPTGNVTIKRDPFWLSSQISVHQCDGAGANYTWYLDNPCKAVLKARVDNGTGAAQTRHLLFLWSAHGAGDPLEYKVIALRENVSIPSGTNVGPFESGLWTDMPRPVNDHPCVRVYILPPAFKAEFDRDAILGTATSGVLTRARVNLMVATYGLIDANWAQRNISMHATEVLCPDASCRVAQIERPSSVLARADDQTQMARPVEQFIAGPRATGPAWQPEDAPHAPSTFVPSQQPPVSGQTSSQVAVNAKSPPRLDRTGNSVFLSGEELQRFAQGNVIVQVRAYGFTARASRTPNYNFIEPMGGVLQMFSTELVRRNQTVPFQFQITNGDQPRTIYLVVDTLVPPGLGGVRFGLDVRPQTYAPDEKRVFNGVVTTGGTGPPPSGFKRFGVSLHAGGSFPQGKFNQVADAGGNVAVDLEVRANNTVSAELIFGYHRFRNASLGPDLSLYQVSGNLKFYTPGTLVRFFVNGGPGVYRFDPGTTEFGGNVGAGLQFNLTPRFAVEGAYNWHFVGGSNTTSPIPIPSASSMRFWTGQIGFRYRF